MAIFSFIILGIGVILIIIGTSISLTQYKLQQQELEQENASEEGVDTEPAGLGDTLKGLAKLADALKEHPPGMQLIIIGIVLIIIGGILGGVSGL